MATNDASALTEIDPEAVKRIYMDLYHKHIPKLVEHDIVEYDQEHDLIFPTDRTTQLKPLLKLSASTDSPEYSCSDG